MIQISKVKLIRNIVQITASRPCCSYLVLKFRWIHFSLSLTHSLCSLLYSEARLPVLGCVITCMCFYPPQVTIIALRWISCTEKCELNTKKHKKLMKNSTFNAGSGLIICLWSKAILLLICDHEFCVSLIEVVLAAGRMLKPKVKRGKNEIRFYLLIKSL